VAHPGHYVSRATGEMIPCTRYVLIMLEGEMLATVSAICGESIARLSAMCGKGPWYPALKIEIIPVKCTGGTSYKITLDRGNGKIRMPWQPKTKEGKTSAKNP
jgi:hypothetical protein